MRIGVFGGTFDPIHVGHLILAEQAREHCQLDSVRFVLSHRPPQKEGQPVTRFDIRAEMTELALAGNPAFVVDPLEQERAGPSYTADTLAQLRTRMPGDELFLLLGGDSLADLPGWREPLRIVELARLAVMARPGTSHPTEQQLRAALRLPDLQPLTLQFVPAPQIDIASRSLRQAVAQGRSIRYLVPRAVEAYIKERNLYRKEGEPGGTTPPASDHY